MVLQHFILSSHLVSVLLVEFKKPFPKAASNSASAARSRACSGSAFEVIGKKSTSCGEALQSSTPKSSSSACCLFISATGLQVKSLFLGWSFLHGSGVRQRAGVEVNVQLGSDLLQASGPRAHVRTGGT